MVYSLIIKQLKNDQENEIFLFQETVKQPRALWLLSEAENKSLADMLSHSGFFELSKVRDISQDLVREFIQ